VTLLNLLTWIGHLFASHGAHRVAIGSVSHSLGWVMSKHWIVKICYRGSAGCSMGLLLLPRTRRAVEALLGQQEGSR